MLNRPFKGLPPYRHEQLPGERYIRLVKLDVVSPNGDIHCSIAAFSLDKCPAFLALSYTWGSAVEGDPGTEETRQLLCSGTRLDGTPNLIDALTVFQKLHHRSFFWIDAICINQLDDAERSAQVSMMDIIYSQAATVLVWLGMPDPLLKSYLWMLNDLQDLVTTYNKRYGESALSRQDIKSAHFLRGLGVPDDVDFLKICKEYAQFCTNRRWFKRAWVIQEVALATNIKVFCGENALDWQRMESLSRLMITSTWSARLNELGVHNAGREVQSMAMARPFCQLERARKGGGLIFMRERFQQFFGKITQEEEWFGALLYILAGARPMKCFDQRDIVFSSIGVANYILPQAMAPPLHADYGKSKAKVYLDLATMAISRGPRLYLLSMVEDRFNRKTEDLPSWAPDYAVAMTTNRLLDRGMGVYDATNARDSQRHEWEVDGSTLVVHGRILDTITFVGPPLDDYLAVLKFLLHMNEAYTPTHQTREEALWRTMVGDISGPVSSRIRPAESFLGIRFREWIVLKLVEVILHDGNTETTSANELGFLYELVPSDGTNTTVQLRDHIQRRITLERAVSEGSRSRVNNEASQFSHILESMNAQATAFASVSASLTKRRRLYSTASGYIGLGPVSVGEGDQISLIEGALVPFILRETSPAGHYQLVGEAYVHGAMRGELIQFDKDFLLNSTEVRII